MNDLIHCPDPDALITLLYDDEGDLSERTALEAHVEACPACADLLATLGAARGTLGAWRAPSLPLGYAVVPVRQWAWQQAMAWGGAAAAAVLVLAGAAAVAGLELTWNDQGLTLRTGRAHHAPPAAVAQASAEPAPTTAADAWISRASAEDAPWRADFDLLATQIRYELEEQTRATEDRIAAALVPPAGSRTMTIDEDRLLARVAALIDQSEARQQQNLALRVTELGREFQLRRQADLVHFQQGLARVEQQRRDLIYRVATRAPQP
jgi:hypothetical protein